MDSGYDPVIGFTCIVLKRKSLKIPGIISHEASYMQRRV
jgi:hypothetical protein